MKTKYQRIKEQIRLEREEKFLLQIDSKDYTEIINKLFFYVKSEDWDAEFAAVLMPIKNNFDNYSACEQKKVLTFLCNLAIGLKSKLVEWYLLPEIGNARLDIAFAKAFAVLKECSESSLDLQQEMLAEIKRQTELRFKAEAFTGEAADKECAELLGDSLIEYVDSIINVINNSQFAKLAVDNIHELSATYLGNDFGAFLQYTIWFGASFQTTNPPLVNMAWDLANPENEALFKKLVAKYYHGSLPDSQADDAYDQLYSLYTMTIVEQNCRLIRDIYLLSGGVTGFVCYQVNPKYHDYAPKMVEEIRYVHGLLTDRLGGVPNISFKLPGTYAGLEAAELLSEDGISLTITLCFGLHQALDFARVFKKSQAMVNSVVIMNGRLAFPVRDELVAAGVDGGEEASQFAGVEVTRHLYQKLYTPESEGGLGCDITRVRIMNASLRIYGDELPDIVDIIGSPSITVFPNARRALDSVPRMIDVAACEQQTPKDKLEILVQSEIFRQAWWCDGDPSEYAPERRLMMCPEDQYALVEWKPINDTLTQFIDSHKTALGTIEEMVSRFYPKFKQLRIDPVINPAVLNTTTWDRESVGQQLQSIPEGVWKDVLAATKGGVEYAGSEQIKIYASSIASASGDNYLLAALDDGQDVFLQVRDKDSGESVLNESITDIQVDKYAVRAFPVDDSNLHAYFANINPQKGPKKLGAVPRLGIGGRHTTSVFPGIWEAMYRGDFSANAIQNSVRELNIMGDVLSGEPPRVNHLFSVGAVQEGHTGSSFEGLWTAGTISAVKSKYPLRYGADADHLQVKRGKEGIERTKQFLNASKYYTFYTLDVSDILDYQALGCRSAKASAEYLDSVITNSKLRRDVVSYHLRSQFINKQTYSLDEARLGRYVKKYWAALDAVSELVTYINGFKQGEAYDLELSIDENPPEVATFDSITTTEELLFLILEIKRRGLPITHLAPNFGVEKAMDYRGPDGHEGLRARVSQQYRLASEYGFMLDCHSGDDLSHETRLVFKDACKGRLHFKISPSLQELFSEAVFELDKPFFKYWWRETYRYAQECAVAGSSFAVASLKRFEQYEREMSPKNYFFREYNFAAVGRRDKAGQFVNRQHFYSYGADFAELMKAKISERLLLVADDIFNY